jgi:hypothetical protein
MADGEFDLVRRFGRGDVALQNDAVCRPYTDGRSVVAANEDGDPRDAAAVALVLDAPSPLHRIYNVVDDEAPDLATLSASVCAPPPDGSAAEAAQADDVLLDGRRLHEDLGFKAEYPRLQDAIDAGA